MQHLHKQLRRIRHIAMDDLTQIQTPEQTHNWQIRYLGENGRITKWLDTINGKINLTQEQREKLIDFYGEVESDLNYYLNKKLQEIEDYDTGV